MIQCDKCGDFVDQDDINPISPDEGVWCGQCCDGKLGSRDLAHEILAGRQVALDGEALKRMAATLLESLHLHQKFYEKLEKIRSLF